MTDIATSVLQAADFVGIWGFDSGYVDNPNEVRISFGADGTGAINPHADRIDLKWSFQPEAGLRLCIADHWIGPFRISIEQRQLPLGTFTSLVSSGPLLPFGLRQFQRISATPAT
jgi:hypothetical protein